MGRMASQFRKWRLSENNAMRALMRPAALAELLRSSLRNPRKSPGLCWNSSDHGGPASHHTGLRDVRHHRETLEVSCPCLDHWEPSVIHGPPWIRLVQGSLIRLISEEFGSQIGALSCSSPSSGHSWVVCVVQAVPCKRTRCQWFYCRGVITVLYSCCFSSQPHHDFII